MCRPLREQARSHIEFLEDTNCVATSDPCGSELARESGITVDDNVECAGLFASRLAPTLNFWKTTNCVATSDPCGSELARESGLSANFNVGYAGLFASRLAPTVFLALQPRILRQVPAFEAAYLLRSLKRRANGIQPEQQGLLCLLYTSPSPRD